jgi:hypothetical protein
MRPKIEFGDAVEVTTGGDNTFLGYFLFETTDGIYLSRAFYGGPGVMGQICDSKDVFFVHISDEFERENIVKIKRIQNEEVKS